MSRDAATQADRAAEVAPAIRHTVPWRVTSVRVLPDYRLDVTFVDGTQGEVDLAAFLQQPQVAASVFAPLKDVATFGQARVGLGAVEWPGGVDLAPDAMYDAIREHGRWVVD